MALDGRQCDVGKENHDSEVTDSKETCRKKLVTESNVYNVVFLPRTAACINDELACLAPWRPQSAMPNYWPDRATRSSDPRPTHSHSTAGRGSSRTHSEVSHSKQHCTSTSSDIRPGRHGHHGHRDNQVLNSSSTNVCPIHAHSRHSTSSSDQATAARNISNNAEPSPPRSCSTVTSPRFEEDCKMGIFLLPNGTNKPPSVLSPRLSSQTTTSPDKGGPAPSTPNLTRHYTPYHLHKQLLVDKTALAYPATGVDLRQQCQQLSSYLWCREQQMQIQRQADGLHTEGHRHEHPTNPLQLLQVRNSSGHLVPEQTWTSRAEQVQHRDATEQVRQTSLTAVNVEPNLPSFSSAFDNMVMDGGKGSVVSRTSQQRRAPNPPTNNLPQQTNWSTTQKAVQAELLSLECMKINEPPQHAMNTRKVTASSREQPENLLLESKEVRDGKDTWRPADSLNLYRTTPYKPKRVSHTCSMVEMSLPSVKTNQKAKAIARQTSSMVNFPLIQNKPRQRHVSIHNTRGRIGRTKGQSQVPTTLPKIDGFKFMGDVSSQQHVDTPLLSTQPSQGSAKKSAPPQQPMARPKLTRTASSSMDAGSAPAAQSSHPKSKTSHLAVEWRAI